MSDAIPEHPQFANLVRRVWRGEERLWKVYWLVAIMGGWALGTSVGVLARAGILNNFLGLALLAVYAVYCGVGVWRCAFNVERPIWGYAARTVIGFSTIFFVVAVVWGV